MASDGRNHWDEGPRIELRGDPAYRYREDEDPGAFLEPEEEHPQGRRRRGFGPLRFALVGLLLVGFGGLMLYAYSWGTGEPEPGELPLVAAPEGVEKERPESPGGLEVPYQDTLVLNPGNEGEEGVERLLPPPEDPQPPEPEAPAQQAEAPAAEAPAAEAEADPAAGEIAVESAPVEEIEVSEAPAPGTPAPTAEAPAEPAAEAPVEEAAEQPAEQPAAAPAQQQAALPPAGGGFLVQLASVGNEAAVEREWGRMQSRHPQLLGSLSLTVERADLGDRGIFYRIQAGPLANREAAEGLCAQLKAQQQDCLVRAR